MSPRATLKNSKKRTLTVRSVKHRPKRTGAIASKSAPLKASSPTTALKRQPLGHLLLEHRLREAGFAGEVLSDEKTLGNYATDESIFHIAPQVVLRPKDARSVEIAVKVIAKETKNFPALSLTPRAAGTGLGGGSLTDSVVLDIATHLNRIGKIEHAKGKVTVTCEPGAPWREVEALLKKEGRYLPPYPASKHICTIGGAVANNAAGPDSLRYGHVADWVEELEVVLKDGHTYKIKPLDQKGFQKMIKQKNLLGEIARQVFALVEENETLLARAKPKTAKNSSGYPLWSVVTPSVAEFKKGRGIFDLTRLFSGSQGTIGVITKVKLRTEPIVKDTTLVTVPVFDLATAGRVVLEAIKYDPINVEVFDSLTYEAAMKNPQFFRSRIRSVDYYRVLFSLYTTFHVRWRRRLPEFVLLITLDGKEGKERLPEMIKRLRFLGGRAAREIINPYEREMFWQVRDASYSLSKLLDPKKRPAAFLEDMTVPPEHLAKFFSDIKNLLKRFNVTAAIHGHGGNAHFHFYPLLDFTSRATPALITKMADEFFATAIKYGGNICGEHNDGIIRTPYLDLMYPKSVLELFKKVERLFDPDDIFNPGKKVNPRFDIRENIRRTN